MYRLYLAGVFIFMLLISHSIHADIIADLRALSASHGDKMEIVRIQHISALQSELKLFQSENDLPWFAEWLIENRFDYESATENMQSVIILAMPRANYAAITFDYNGKQYKAYGVMAADFGKSINYMVEAVKTAGYNITPYSLIPLKRLAVQSGLAEYGKNNIAYVQGMGAKINLMAFYTDIPIETDNWREMVVSQNCADCDICVKVCPTGAIREDTFLLDSHNCLVFLNESMAREIPDWVPASAHHTLYGCLKCQVNCPMNDGMGEILHFAFDEAETARILAGGAFDDITGEFREKIDKLGITRSAVVPRNLRLLIDLQDQGVVPNLFIK
jgi:epoxyqueuosine reductase